MLNLIKSRIKENKETKVKKKYFKNLSLISSVMLSYVSVMLSYVSVMLRKLRLWQKNGFLIKKRILLKQVWATTINFQELFSNRILIGFRKKLFTIAIVGTTIKLWIGIKWPQLKLSFQKRNLYWNSLKTCIFKKEIY